MKNRKKLVLPVIMTVLVICVLAGVVFARVYSTKLQMIPDLQKKSECFIEQEHPTETYQKTDPESEPELNQSSEVAMQEKEESEPQSSEQKMQTSQLQSDQTALGSAAPSYYSGSPVSSGTAPVSVTAQNNDIASSSGDSELPSQPETTEEPIQPENPAPASGGMWENELEIDP